MAEEYFLFQKFTDINIANEIAGELKKDNIEYHLQNNLQSAAPGFVTTSIDLEMGLNFKSGDFPKADKILDDYYKKELINIDKVYYLFDLSNDELREIISKPYEWGHLDYQLAKQILKEKGMEINDATVQKIKDDSIVHLSKREHVSKARMLSGYVLSVIFPFAGAIIGYGILNNSRILPNGEKFLIHSAKQRKHGQIILAISIIWLCIIVLLRIITQR